MKLADSLSQSQTYFDVTYLKDTPSTNNHAKKIVQELRKPTVILTSHQTQGRGRGNNTWTDAKDQCLLSTWVWPRLTQPAKPQWTLLVGFLVAQAVDRCFPEVSVSIKPPNDLYSGSKKLGGILLEAVSQGGENHLLIGLGLNLWAEPLPEATSIQKELTTHGQELDLAQAQRLVGAIAENLQNVEDVLGDSQWNLKNIEEPLKIFINRHSLFRDSPLKSVTPEGDLICQQKTLRWTDL